jgi:integrase
MFNLAIDSKLRGCDVIALRVEDVAAGGYTADRATVRQKKTGRPVRFELSEQTRQAVDDYPKMANKRPGEFLFAGRRGPNRNMTTRQYAKTGSPCEPPAVNVSNLHGPILRLPRWPSRFVP